MTAALATAPPPPTLLRIPSSPDPYSQIPLPLSPMSASSPRSELASSPGRSPGSLFPPIPPPSPSSSSSHQLPSRPSLNFSRPMTPQKNTTAHVPNRDAPGAVHPPPVPLSPAMRTPPASPRLPPSASLLPSLVSKTSSTPPRLKASKSIMQRLPTFLRRTTKRSVTAPAFNPPAPPPPTSPSVVATPPSKRASRSFDLPALLSPTKAPPGEKQSYRSRPEHRLLAQSLLSATPVGGGLGLGGEGPAPGSADRMSTWRQSVIPPGALDAEGWKMHEEKEWSREKDDDAGEKESVHAWKFPASPTTPTNTKWGEELASPTTPRPGFYQANQHTRMRSSSTPNLHEDHPVVDRVDAAYMRPTAVSLTRYAAPHLPLAPPTSSQGPNHLHVIEPNRAITSSPTPPPPSPSRQTPPPPSRPTARPAPPSARSKLHRLTTFFEPPSKRRERARAQSEEPVRQGLGDRLVMLSPEELSRKIREWEVESDGEDGDGEEGRERMEKMFM